MNDTEQKLIDFIFLNGGCELSRPGCYTVGKEELEAAYEDFKETGINRFTELDKIVWAIEGRGYGHPFGNFPFYNEEEIEFYETALSKQTFWNIYRFHDEETITKIKDLIEQSKTAYETQRTYVFKRRKGFTNLLKKQALERDGNKCIKCPNRLKLRLEIDHIKPLIKGGENTLENLQTLCRTCHKEKTKQDRRT